MPLWLFVDCTPFFFSLNWIHVNLIGFTISIKLSHNNDTRQDYKIYTNNLTQRTINIEIPGIYTQWHDLLLEPLEVWGLRMGKTDGFWRFAWAPVRANDAGIRRLHTSDAFCGTLEGSRVAGKRRLSDTNWKYLYNIRDFGFRSPGVLIIKWYKVNLLNLL